MLIDIYEELLNYNVFLLVVAVHIWLKLLLILSGTADWLREICSLLRSKRIVNRLSCLRVALGDQVVLGDLKVVEGGAEGIGVAVDELGVVAALPTPILNKVASVSIRLSIRCLVRKWRERCHFGLRRFSEIEADEVLLLRSFRFLVRIVRTLPPRLMFAEEWRALGLLGELCCLRIGTGFCSIGVNVGRNRLTPLIYGLGIAFAEGHVQSLLDQNRFGGRVCGDHWRRRLLLHNWLLFSGLLLFAGGTDLGAAAHFLHCLLARLRRPRLF